LCLFGRSPPEIDAIDRAAVTVLRERELRIEQDPDGGGGRGVARVGML
jgi:hypothetical protein